MSTLWHGRFAGGQADELVAFTVSLPFDRRLAADDLACSRATRCWRWGLARVRRDGSMLIASRSWRCAPGRSGHARSGGRASLCCRRTLAHRSMSPRMK